MEKASEALLSLRPVTFHYKNDVKATRQFGLIAEEVAKVNPALVVLDKEGRPYSVRYDQVNAMLLNEFLKERRAFLEEQCKVERLEEQVAALAAGLQKVSAQLAMRFLVTPLAAATRPTEVVRSITTPPAAAIRLWALAPEPPQQVTVTFTLAQG